MTEYDTFEALRNPLFHLQSEWHTKLNKVFAPNIRINITPEVYSPHTYVISVDVDQIYHFTVRLDRVDDPSVVDATFSAIVHDLTDIVLRMI